MFGIENHRSLAASQSSSEPAAELRCVERIAGR